MKKFILVLLIVLIIAAFYGLGPSVRASTPTQRLLSAEPNKIDPALQAALTALQPGDMTRVIVTLKRQADLTRIGGSDREQRLKGIIQALQATARSAQRAIKAYLVEKQSLGLVGEINEFWVFDGLSVSATQEVIIELAARDDVFSVTPDEIAVVPESLLTLAAPETNLALVNAPALWDLGLTGQGIVVANMDSGVDGSHPDLASRWRGGSNSWFDPYGQHLTTPTDLSGHGTWTMGVMVGGDAGGTSIGLAPAAQWIAVKIFNDAGSATATAIHQGFQWLLDPDGNINTPDAPNVVNNSWTFATPGCDLEFQLDLQSLRAAGILPVFAAGNGGPSAGSSYSPSNYPGAFAVGATDNSDGIYAYSSRGPSACGESTTIYPELMAPGVNIHTSDRYSLYTNQTGTSLAAPSVTGGLAQLLGANPNLSADQQASALLNSAVDLGAAGPDNDFGFGRLDLLAAYQWLLNPPTPTPTSVPPTPTPTPDPTINLALNKTVTVSSNQDSAHAGSMAVDGNLATLWQTARVKGNNKLPSEWIEIDLGGSMSIGKVVLEWDANYATSYTLQVSNDHSTWSTVSTTSSGNGGNDTLTFNPITARYVRMDSTTWSSGSLRNWLNEIQVFAGGGSGSTPTPTPTSTPTTTPPPSPTPTPTATPTVPPGGGSTLHVGDLDGSSAPANRSRWNANITVFIHDAAENPLYGVTVSGTWSNGASGSASCVTDNAGSCTVTIMNLRNGSATFTVTSVTHPSLSYNAAANHDPDGDSDGTTITVLRP